MGYWVLTVGPEKAAVCYDLRTETSDTDNVIGLYSGDQSHDWLRLASTSHSRLCDQL